MAWVPGGQFLMGSDRHYPEERPAHRAAVDRFWMDVHTVTNAEFRRFAEATGHLTLAERPANPDDYPGARPELLVPSPVVFRQPRGPVDLRNHLSWWAYVPGACRHHLRWGEELHPRRQDPGQHLAGLRLARHERERLAVDGGSRLA
jgi:sulfatase modifying factor 1